LARGRNAAGKNRQENEKKKGESRAQDFHGASRKDWMSFWQRKSW
jgi:hypothetical protein